MPELRGGDSRCICVLSIVYTARIRENGHHFSLKAARHANQAAPAAKNLEYLC